MKNVILASLVVAAAAGSAMAVSNGDIVFTNQNNNSISTIANPGGSNTLTQLLTLPGPGFGVSGAAWRPSGITADNNGRYYFGNDAFTTIVPGVSGTRNNNAIYAVDGLFSGAPVQSFFTDAEFPQDVDFDAGNDSLQWVQNPFRFFAGESVQDGLYGSSVVGPATQQFFAENTSGSRPYYEAGVFMTKDPNSNSFFVTALNGGVGTGFSDAAPSSIWRYTPNYSNPALSTVTLIKDLTSDAALVNPIRWARGITAIPGTNDIYFTNTNADFSGFTGNTAGVYKITLNPDGTYNNLSLVLPLFQPEAIEFNPYTNKLVISQFNDLNGNGQADDGLISQINLDGSGYEVLASGVHARDFHIVPTPGALALAGVGGLVALRRRRAA
jgi:hypothetical protein